LLSKRRNNFFYCILELLFGENYFKYNIFVERVALEILLGYLGSQLLDVIFAGDPVLTGADLVFLFLDVGAVENTERGHFYLCSCDLVLVHNR
jgi:hypothetical protein